MALFRESKDFAEGLRQAAERLDLDAGFVEKDYWVTQALRALAGRYGGSVVFKGGTSLSKGFGIIQRFSEDVDVLVRPVYKASIKDREQRLGEITDFVAGELGLPWQPRRNPTRGRNASRADVLVYPQLIQPTVDVPRLEAGVLLETGYGDGREPALTVVLAPMLCGPLEIGPGEYDDTQPFELAALEPVRTLLEKLSLLHHVATRVLEGDADARDARIGRHYHDIDRLLKNSDTVARLRGNREECEAILDEIEAISNSQYGGFTPRPKGGYVESPAFAPPAGSALRDWLESRYDASADLLPHRTPAKWPGFGTVLNHIERHRDLL